MPTIRAGNRLPLGLDVGKVLTVTCDAVSSAIVRTYPSNTQGIQANGSTAVAAGTSVSFGPYLVASRFQVECLVGTVDYVIGEDAPESALEKPIVGTTAAQAAFTSLVSGGGIWGAGVRRASFTSKPMGGLINATATPATSTYLLVTASPVPYDAVRVTYQHWGGAGAIGVVTGLKALIGATDDIGTQDFTDVTAAAFKVCVTPRRAGVEYATAVTDGSPGWKAVTWGGAFSVNIAGPGAGAVLTAASDIIYEKGVVDANGVYPLLIRYNYGSAGYSYVTNLTGQQTGTNWKDDVPGMPLISLSRSGDSVTTPSGWLNSSTPSAASSAGYWYIEYFSGADCVSVDVVLDSRGGVSSESSGTKQYLSFEIALRNAIRASGRNVAIQRHSISGGSVIGANTTTGTANPFIDALPAQSLGQPSNWLVYQLYSVNDGTLTDGLMTLVLGRAARFAAAARASGQRVCFILPFPKDGGFTAPELARIATIKEFAVSNGDTYFDPIAAYGDATGAWVLYRYDTSHMTDAGYRAMGAAVAALMV